MKIQSSPQKRNIVATSIASSFASMIARFVMHPVDTMKAKVQVSKNSLKSVSDYKVGMVTNLIKQTYKNQGVPGFFRGVSISVFGSAFAFALYIGAYEHTKHSLAQYPFFSKYSSLSHLLSGFVAQVVSCSLWLPIDIIKQRMQVQSSVKLYSYKSPRQAWKKIKNAQGLIGLYRAFGATLLFFGPFSAIFFASFEKMKDIFVKDKHNQTLSQSIICSSLAGAIAGYLTTPLEIVKLRLQVQRFDQGPRGGSVQNSVFGYKNAFHGLSLLVKNEGFLALWKGAFLRICYSVPINTIQMTLTEYFKQIILRKKEILDSFI